MDNKTVVRLTTNCYTNSRGVVHERRIQYLKRKSVGFNILNHFSEGDPGDEYRRIENIDECRDGIYEVKYNSVSTDIESGHMDDWSYILTPLNTDSN